MIYWDNAATTWPKPMAVTEAMSRALTRYGANPGRGGHTMGMAASREVYRCRETAAEFFHLDNPGQVVFTLNCTMAMNMALKGILRTSGRVVVSDLEHNAVMRPLHVLSPGRPIYDVAQVTPGDDDQTVEAFRRCITPFTRAIVCTHASNVFGVQLPIRRLGELAREHDLLFVVDAAQTAGVLPLDMEADHIDFLCVAGHKGLYGPQGTGVLLCGKDVPVRTLLEGGTGSLSEQQAMPDFLPDRLEAGTHNMPGIAGLLAGVRFVRQLGPEAICAEERQLAALAAEGLRRIPGLRVYALPDLAAQTGVLSVVPEHLDAEALGNALAERGIAVRAGLHCAPLAHRTAGTLDTGSVRISFSHWNTREEVHCLLAAIGEICQ